MLFAKAATKTRCTAAQKISIYNWERLWMLFFVSLSYLNLSYWLSLSIQQKKKRFSRNKENGIRKKMLETYYKKWYWNVYYKDK